MLFELWHLRESFVWNKRRSILKTFVRKTIEAEGGEIQRISIIGFLLRSPFPPLAFKPVYLRADCSYPNDSGTWFIRDVEKGPTTWVWKSDLERPDLPVSRADGSFADSRIAALPPWVGLAGYVGLIAVVILGLWLL
jgi:hypothetical protein